MQYFKSLQKINKPQLVKFQRNLPSKLFVDKNNLIKNGLFSSPKNARFYCSELVSSKTFEELQDLHPDLKKGLKSKGLDKMFLIQEKTWTTLSEGRDLVGRAKTGSGKTLAFVMPILNRIKQKGLRLIPNKPYALVLGEKIFESFPLFFSNKIQKNIFHSLRINRTFNSKKIKSANKRTRESNRRGIPRIGSFS